MIKITQRLKCSHLFAHKRVFPATKIPNEDYFKQLTLEELRQFPNKSGRKRSDFEKNITAALALPYSTKQLGPYATKQDLLIERCKDHIIEHANRRIDLFFYTMVAYYESDTPPTIAPVHMQHGRGRKSPQQEMLTQGCHSSLLPSLLDKTIYNNLGTDRKYRSILSNTHFLDSLNAVIELPKAVNDFDNFLECTCQCREKSLTILQQVALGHHDPIEGLTLFLQFMSQIFADAYPGSMNNQYRLFSSSGKKKPSHLKFNPKLIAYTAEGTLQTTFDWGSQEASKKYIHALLRIHNHHTLSRADMLRAMKEIQQEILTPKETGPTLVCD